MEVADLFLSIKKATGRKYELVVPIPFCTDDYISLFEQEEKERFERLKGLATRYFELKVPTTRSKDELYRFGGQFVADSSLILIALWDGNINNKIGGTSDIVRYKRTGTFMDTDVDQIYEKKGAVLSLYCRRKSDPAQKSVEPVLPQKGLLENFQDIPGLLKALEMIEQLNIHAQTLPAAKLADSMAQLFPPTYSLSNANGMLRSFYGQTDMAASINQKIYIRSLKTLFVLGLLIVASFEWYKHLDLTERSLAIVMSLMVIAFCLWIISYRRNNHLHFVESRILCEALRIQFYWNLSNIQETVTRYILRIYREEVAWLPHILHAINGYTYQQAAPGIDLSMIENHWLMSQKDYFASRLHRVNKTRKILNVISWVAFTAALLIMIMILLYEEYLHRQGLLHYMIVIIGILLGIFALSKAYIEKRGFRQVSNQYLLMKDIYQTTIDKMEELKSSAAVAAGEIKKEIRRLYYLAGKEALIECGNWYLILKEKGPEIEGMGG